MRRPVTPEDFVRAIGRRVAEIRKAKGLTQREVAEELGVTIPWVSRIERAGENLQIETMVRIAQALGVEPHELWKPPGDSPVRRGRPKKVQG